MTIRIIIADDHPVILAGFTQMLSAIPELQLVAAVSDSSALVEALSYQEADVAVTDFSMPGGQFGDGLVLLGFLQRRFPQLPLVVLTGMESPAALASIRSAGICRIVSKADPAQEIADAVVAAAAGEPYLSASIQAALQQVAPNVLSQREGEVLRMLAEGMSVVQIAARLQRSQQTISAQKSSAMKKLGLTSAAEFFDYAVASGLVQASQATRGLAGRRREDS